MSAAAPRLFTELVGLSIRAMDGSIGHVADLLFDDRSFDVRWIVADTGGWLPGRKVLLSPSAARDVDLFGRSLVVDTDTAAVKSAPSVAEDAPASRQREEDIFAHYRWTPYWAFGTGAAGPAVPTPLPPAATGVPDVERPGGVDPAAGEGTGDPNLRSLGEVKGYRIEAPEGTTGHVEDARTGAPPPLRLRALLSLRAAEGPDVRQRRRRGGGRRRVHPPTPTVGGGRARAHSDGQCGLLAQRPYRRHGVRRMIGWHKWLPDVDPGELRGASRAELSPSGGQA